MTPLREAALSLLPDKKGIFLRCDRGEALYVTNAPARTDEQIDWRQVGFGYRAAGKLIFLTPQLGWAARLEKWLEQRTSVRRLRRSVENADFHSAADEDMALFVEGVKRIELMNQAADYERSVRQRAAVCLREKKGGGTIRVCALIADYLREGGRKDEA